MTNCHHQRTVRALLALVVLPSAASLSLGGQSPAPIVAGRAIVQDAGLAGIDLGLRAQDITAEPASRGRIRAVTDAASERLRHGAPALRGSLIVKFKDGAGPAAVSGAMRVSGASKRSRPSDADFDLLEIPADLDPESAAAALREQPDVEYAQPRYLNRARFRPNDPLYSLQWNWPALDMERAWDIQPGSSNSIVVAVLDSGVAYRTVTFRYTADSFVLTPGGPRFPPLGTVEVPFAAAPELGDSSRFVAPRDFIWNDDAPVDLDGHGTHVAGTIGQLTNNSNGVAGMAYNVKLMPVKVLSEVWDDIFNSPEVGTDDVIARAIRYAVDNGARVINMSFGRTEGGSAPAVEAACRYAVSRGAFIAVSAGNERESGNAPDRLAEIAARIDGMMAVGAVGRDLSAAWYSTSNAYVEISAPGGNARGFGASGAILQQTLAPDQLHTYLSGPARFASPRADTFVYGYLQGTSMAAPHVSGLAALLMQQGITSPAAIEAAIAQFATDRGPAGRDSEYGAGLINPRNTLRGLGLAR